MIPKGWEYKKIKDVGEVTSGGTPDTTNAEYWDGNINWCTPTDITALNGYKFLGDTVKKITNSGLKNSSAKLLPPNSIIVCTRATIGKAAINLVPMSTNQGFKNIVPKLVDSNFLYYKIVSEELGLLKIASGSTFLEVSKTDFDNYEILIPSPKEQIKIADILSTCDEAIDKLSKLIVSKEKQKKGLMQNLLTGKVRFKEFTKSKRKYVPLKEIIKEFIVPMRDKPKDLSGDIPWCRIEDFDGIYLEKSKSGQGVTIEIAKEMNLKIYPIDTVLVSCSAYLGRCAIVKKPLVTNQTFIGLKPSETINPLFLYYYMCFSERELNLLSSGTTISYLSREEFENFEIELPLDITEQKQIATTLYEADSEISNLKAQLLKLKNQKKGLMQQLLTGKIRVK